MRTRVVLVRLGPMRGDPQGGSPDGAISFEIGYATPPFAGPSGIPIAVDGAAHLQVVFRPGRGYDGVTGERTYTGPAEIVPVALEHVREIQLVEDFEATLVWIVGLDQAREFAVFQLDQPDPEGEGMTLVTRAAMTQDTRVALSNSFGFGGQNTALLFRRWDA